jgi:hypothetical protein
LKKVVDSTGSSRYNGVTRQELTDKKGNTVRFEKRSEVWNTRNGAIRKTAVRNTLGQFHGATNFRERQSA